MTNLGLALLTAQANKTGKDPELLVKKTEAAQKWTADFKKLCALVARLQENRRIHEKAVEIAKKLSQDLSSSKGKASKVDNNLVNIEDIRKLRIYKKQVLKIAK